MFDTSGKWWKPAYLLRSLKIEKVWVHRKNLITGALAHLARASGLQPEGNRFDSDMLHHSTGKPIVEGSKLADKPELNKPRKCYRKSGMLAGSNESGSGEPVHHFK